MKTVAVLGANGFVGKKIYSSLTATGVYRVFPVTRENYAASIGKSYDIIINSAMPSARFWAKQHPDKDFIETVQKTADLLYGYTYGKFVQISTVSARCEPHTIYGRHKLAAETLCNSGNNLIVRLSAMFGDGLTKGALIDLLKGRKVFVGKESRYSFSDVSFVGDYIASHLDLTGVKEVGARDTMSLSEVAEYLQSPSEFEGPAEVQEILRPDPSFPQTKKVFAFLDEMKKKII